MERIIEAVSLLDKTSYELVIAGDGSEKGKLEKYSKDLSVNAKFLGRIEHDEINDLYKKCGTFVSLNESEAFGLTYAEALLSGCKIVCPETGGQVEFLMNYPDRVSFVDVLNSDSIAMGINRCLKTNNLNVNNEMIADFKYEETAKKIIKIAQR